MLVFESASRLLPSTSVPPFTSHSPRSSPPSHQPSPALSQATFTGFSYRVTSSRWSSRLLVVLCPSHQREPAKLGLILRCLVSLSRSLPSASSAVSWAITCTDTSDQASVRACMVGSCTHSLHSYLLPFCSSLFAACSVWSSCARAVAGLWSVKKRSSLRWRECQYFPQVSNSLI